MDRTFLGGKEGVKEGKLAYRPLTVVCYEDLELLKVLNASNVDEIYPATMKNSNQFIVGTGRRPAPLFLGIHKRHPPRVGQNRGSSNNRNNF
jgi:hypothetical protein